MEMRRTSQSLCGWPPSSLASHRCLPGGRRVPQCEGGLMLGKTEGGRRRGQQRMRWLDGITDSMDLHRFL